MRRIADEEYWGAPIPGFGDPERARADLGLAPAAHGGNRTGRVFTGDRSGDWLFGSLHRTGFANQPTSTHRGDGLALRGAWIAAAVRCAPPANRPTPEERDACLPWSVRGARPAAAPPARRLPRRLRVGRRAAAARSRRACRTRGRGRASATTSCSTPATGCRCSAASTRRQQNTFTGRLTEPMMDAVFARARAFVAE